VGRKASQEVSSPRDLPSAHGSISCETRLGCSGLYRATSCKPAREGTALQPVPTLAWPPAETVFPPVGSGTLLFHCFRAP